MFKNGKYLSKFIYLLNEPINKIRKMRNSIVFHFTNKPNIYFGYNLYFQQISNEWFIIIGLNNEPESDYNDKYSTSWNESKKLYKFLIKCKSC